MTNPNKRKQRIINAAMETLKENSIEDVSMRKIAKNAGLTTGAIYHFYKSKDELLFDVMQQNLHFSTRLYENLKSQDLELPANEILNKINEEVSSRIQKEEQQRLHVQFISDIIKRDCKIKGEYKKSYIKMIDAVAKLFEKSFEINDEGFHKTIASILIAAMDGIAIQQALEVVPVDTDEIIKAYIEFFNKSIPIYLNEKKQD